MGLLCGEDGGGEEVIAAGDDAGIGARTGHHDVFQSRWGRRAHVGRGISRRYKVTRFLEVGWEWGRGRDAAARRTRGENMKEERAS